jgi:beta-RFAP synthase
MTRVEAPARLHFGLLSLPLAGAEVPPARQFGGIGLMIDSPRVGLNASRSDEWLATGPNAARALAFAQQFVQSLPVEGQQRFAIRIEQCPEAHSGLGSGTALALAVAKAIACETGHGDWPAAELAKRVGRGERSAVGVHGFERGGLIFEAGKLPGESLAPLVGHHEFPCEWRIVLARPAGEAHWHGSREVQAFSRLQCQNPTDALCRLVLAEMLPALAAKDLDRFGEALHEYNARAGEAFAAEQGGSYASPAIAALIALLRKQGIRGVGQSSWGPTVFAVVADEVKALQLENSLARQAPLGLAAIQSTCASAAGSRVMLQQ